jgi:MEMO1 family protein
LFVISSDFCHWGDNFDYKPIMPEFQNKVPQQIFKSIEALDMAGITLIQNHDLIGFQKYLKDTENTICGERPI